MDRLICHEHRAPIPSWAVRESTGLLLDGNKQEFLPLPQVTQGYGRNRCPQVSCGHLGSRVNPSARKFVCERSQPFTGLAPLLGQ